MHLAGIHLKNDRLAAPGTYPPSRLRLVGKMDVVSFALFQSFGHDRRQESLHGAVIQDIGRLPLFQLQINLDAVTLVGPNEVARIIEREALLVARFYALDARRTTWIAAW